MYEAVELRACSNLCSVLPPQSTDPENAYPGKHFFDEKIHSVKESRYGIWILTRSSDVRYQYVCEKGQDINLHINPIICHISSLNFKLFFVPLKKIRAVPRFSSQKMETQYTFINSFWSSKLEAANKVNYEAGVHVVRNTIYCES